jgi:hypothetical protein
VLLTLDRGFQYEQNLAGTKMAVIIFSAKSIALKDLLPHVPACLTLLSKIKARSCLARLLFCRKFQGRT